MDNKNNNYIFQYLSQRQIASIFVQDVGFQSCAPNHGWGPNFRDYYLMHYIISGEGYYIFNGTKYHLHAGDAFLIYPLKTACYYADLDNPWEYYWVGFNGNDAKILLSLTEFTLESPVLSVLSNDILELFLQIYNAKGPNAYHSTRMAGYLYLMLSYFMETAQNNRTPAETCMQDNLKTAQEYIIKHYQDEITVEELAEITGISRSWLYRCFKQLTGLSPNEYLTNYRIERAKILLQNSTHTIKQTAYSVGFKDELYFSKIFKRMTGKSPSEYKNHFH